MTRLVKQNVTMIIWEGSDSRLRTSRLNTCGWGQEEHVPPLWEATGGGDAAPNVCIQIGVPHCPVEVAILHLRVNPHREKGLVDGVSAAVGDTACA